ncbi:hypothetical protein M8J75_016232 [Diaphorina citri]|nr:hypothetical protein M8J75_016232 [Diaphorina citri]
MMSEQYLLSSHVEGHPSNSLVTKPRPPRNIKRSMMSLKPNINCFLPYPTIDKEHLKICNGEIHTKTVEDTIQNFKPNKVLNEAPPPIAKEEKELPRKTRARLAQLRSVRPRLLGEGFSFSLTISFTGSGSYSYTKEVHETTQTNTQTTTEIKSDRTEELIFNETMAKNASDQLEMDRSCVWSTAMDRYYNDNFKMR